MSNKTIKVECEIPAPPEGWVYDGYRCALHGEMYQDNWNDGKWHKNDCARPTDYCFHCAIPAQAEAEPRELVRFFYTTHPVDDKLGGILAEDDQGKIHYIRDGAGEEGHRSHLGRRFMGGELHPRLTIRRDGKGGWEGELHTVNGELPPLPSVYPCDQDGNPIPQSDVDRFMQQALDAAREMPSGQFVEMATSVREFEAGEYMDLDDALDTPPPPVEGWIPKGDYWLAELGFDDDGTFVGCIDDDDHDSRFGVSLEQCVDDHRCVGFLRMDDFVAEPYGEMSLREIAKPYSRLLDWRATHAVMEKEDG